MNTFVSHPSVRVKGTEHQYEPTLCEDHKCTMSWPHMHCPFCINTETYQDPVILKAHYRVKHVDKGIEFAGLKILRCCQRCDIVGTIKGVKAFKGPHWHCYRCRNGFNRRDEAVKHYRTHFRNPHTTFQIQVTQDITSSSVKIHDEASGQADGMRTDMSQLIETVVVPDQGGLSCGEPESPGSADDREISSPPPGGGSGELQVPVAANETVGTSGDGQTIMIIQETGSGPELASWLAGPVSAGTAGSGTTTLSTAATSTAGLGLATVSLASSEAGYLLNGSLLSTAPTTSSQTAETQCEQLRLKLSEVTQQLEEIRGEKERVVSELTQQIDTLRYQVQFQSEELERARARQTELLAELADSRRNEEDLLSQLGGATAESRVEQLLASLKQQHTELLNQQLLQLRQNYLHQTTACRMVSTSDVKVAIGTSVTSGDGGPLISGDDSTGPVPSLLVFPAKTIKSESLIPLEKATSDPVNSDPALEQVLLSQSGSLQLTQLHTSETDPRDDRLTAENVDSVTETGDLVTEDDTGTGIEGVTLLSPSQLCPDPPVVSQDMSPSTDPDTSPVTPESQHIETTSSRKRKSVSSDSSPLSHRAARRRKDS